MTANYNSLQVKASALLTKYGQVWTVTRNGQTVGKLSGAKIKAENSSVRVGLVQASSSTVQLVLEATPVIKPGDTLTADKVSYLVSSVEKVEPSSTSIVQKVTAV